MSGAKRATDEARSAPSVGTWMRFSAPVPMKIALSCGLWSVKGTNRQAPLIVSRAPHLRRRG